MKGGAIHRPDRHGSRRHPDSARAGHPKTLKPFPAVVQRRSSRGRRPGGGAGARTDLLGVAGEDGQHALRHPGADRQLRQGQRRQRSLVGRLQYHLRGGGRASTGAPTAAFRSDTESCPAGNPAKSKNPQHSQAEERNRLLKATLMGKPSQIPTESLLRPRREHMVASLYTGW